MKNRKQWLFWGMRVELRRKCRLSYRVWVSAETMYPYRPQTVRSFVECLLWGRGTGRQAEAGAGWGGSLGSALPLPSLDGPPAGLFLPCHSFFPPARGACCPTPFLSPPALRTGQLKQFLPLPFHPSENCGLAEDQHTRCRKLLL